MSFIIYCANADHVRYAAEVEWNFKNPYLKFLRPLAKKFQRQPQFLAIMHQDTPSTIGMPN